MTRTHERGRLGETLAARHLEDLGWTVLDRNWRASHGEIDLVVRKGNVVAFVEVKTLARVGASDPLEAITRRKRMEIEKTARRWILKHGDGLRYRFDAVAVTLHRDGRAEILYLPDAWWIGDP